MKFKQRGYSPPAEKEMASLSDEDAAADVMEQHDQFVSSMQSRLAKLQVFLSKVILIDYTSLWFTQDMDDERNITLIRSSNPMR